MAQILPNFIIIGAMRSGTTSLARYLGAHPQVFMAAKKEVHFFDFHFDRSLDWYARHFARAGGKTRPGAAGALVGGPGEPGGPPPPPLRADPGPGAGAARLRRGDRRRAGAPGQSETRVRAAGRLSGRQPLSEEPAPRVPGLPPLGPPRGHLRGSTGRAARRVRGGVPLPGRRGVVSPAYPGPADQPVRGVSFPRPAEPRPPAAPSSAAGGGST